MKKAAVLIIMSSIAMGMLLILARFNLDKKGLDNLFISLGHLGLVSLAAAMVSRRFISRKSKRPFFRFKAIIVTLGLFFGVVASQLSTGFLQKEIFGKPYIFSAPASLSEEPSAEAPTATRQTPQSVAKGVVEILIEAVNEEVLCRWLILELLISITTPGGALVASSLLFATLHAVIPIANGDPDVFLYLLVPTFLIGLWSGIAYLRYGIMAAITVHFMTNLLRTIAEENVLLAGYMAISLTLTTLIVLPLTLWFTRPRTTPPLIAE